MKGNKSQFLLVWSEMKRPDTCLFQPYVPAVWDECWDGKTFVCVCVFVWQHAHIVLYPFIFGCAQIERNSSSWLSRSIQLKLQPFFIVDVKYTFGVCDVVLLAYCCACWWREKLPHNSLLSLQLLADQVWSVILIFEMYARVCMTVWWQKETTHINGTTRNILSVLIK